MSILNFLTDIDECQTKNTCHNGGTCKNGRGGYICFCKAGYTGKNCRQKGLYGRTPDFDKVNCKISFIGLEEKAGLKENI